MVSCPLNFAHNSVEYQLFIPKLHTSDCWEAKLCGISCVFVLLNGPVFITIAFADFISMFAQKLFKKGEC